MSAPGAIHGNNTLTVRFWSVFQPKKCNFAYQALEQGGTQVSTQVSTQVEMVLGAIGGGELTASEIMGALGFSERSTFRKNYLRPALESGLVERTIPGKPNSRLQKYRRARGV